MTDTNKALLDKMITNDKFAWNQILAFVNENAEMELRGNYSMEYTGLMITRRAEKNFISDAQPKLTKAEQDRSHSHEFTKYMADILYSHMKSYEKDAKETVEAVE